ncbi:MAG: GNAT family N-acetyltransferase [Pseudomonadales bacterium]|nr:GNAT family N-acetyltransferase [Pseudomonadales bacterium]
MLLKPITAAQFDAVFNILEENARWFLAKNIKQWPLHWLASKETEIRLSIDSGHYYYTEINHQMAAIVEIKQEPEELWNNDSSAAIYMHKLAIQRKISASGLGIKMLDAIKDLASDHGADSIRLDCVAHNLKLRQYYEAYGFTFKGETNNGDIVLALFEYPLHR